MPAGCGVPGGPGCGVGCGGGPYGAGSGTAGYGAGCGYGLCCAAGAGLIGAPPRASGAGAGAGYGPAAMIASICRAISPAPGRNCGFLASIACSSGRIGCGIDGGHGGSWYMCWLSTCSNCSPWNGGVPVNSS